MALPAGTHIGAYEVTGLLGAGGMGEVYRARDSKLKREVAIKVLPADVASDKDRLARFQREAEVLASLNHPHIAHVYGIEDTALVMELVEGEDLSQRIARGPIPIDEALAIARQIAEALESAHEHGIVHRDLKPANIKVRDDGTVKVLDFGLAKQGSGIGDQGSGEPANSPTITSPAMTMRGVILGTAAYMSPEQAKGKVVDKRADIWAFGCVLFEMLTGKRAFKGDDATDIITSVMRDTPDWNALPAASASSQFIVRRCLEKDPRRRLRDIGEARLALEGSFALTESERKQPTSRTAIAALAAALVVIAVMAVPAMRGLRRTAAPVAGEIRAEIEPPGSNAALGYALSPDGSQIAFGASDETFSGLWLRTLSGSDAQPIKGTQGGRLPFWSPDGRSLGFFSGATLKRIDLGSDAPRDLAEAIFGQGGTWNEQGEIVFAGALFGTLLRVPANGGPVTPVTSLATGQTGHLFPQFLPDGRTLTFTVVGNNRPGVHLATIDSSAAPVELAPGEGVAAFVADGSQGWLLWVDHGRLQARRLDLDRRQLTGDPITLAERVAGVVASRTGLIAYREAIQTRHQLTWMNRSGETLGTVGDIDARVLGTGARVSPEGKRIAVTREVQGNTDIWLLDGTRSTRLTFDAGLDAGALWSPDGTQLLFGSTRDGALNMFQKLSSGAGAETRVFPAEGFATVATDWSRDERYLIGFTNLGKTGADLVVWPWSKGSAGTHRVFLQTPFNEVFPKFSPDGRWVAYQSDQSGRNEAYVRPFESSAGEQWQVSSAGGVRPTWSRDGKELYFLDPAGNMMAAIMTSREAAMETGTPVKLFASRIVAGGIESMQVTDYDVAPDGRFLINVDLGSVVPSIRLIINWHPPK